MGGRVDLCSPWACGWLLLTLLRLSTSFQEGMATCIESKNGLPQRWPVSNAGQHLGFRRCSPRRSRCPHQSAYRTHVSTALVLLNWTVGSAQQLRDMHRMLCAKG